MNVSGLLALYTCPFITIFLVGSSLLMWKLLTKKQKDAIFNYNLSTMQFSITTFPRCKAKEGIIQPSPLDFCLSIFSSLPILLPTTSESSAPSLTVGETTPTLITHLTLVTFFCPSFPRVTTERKSFLLWDYEYLLHT